MKGMGRSQLVLVSIATALGAGVLAALVLAVVDLYVVGHGGESLSRPWIDWGAAGLSRADAAMLVASATAGLGTFLLGRRTHGVARGP